MKNWFVDKDSIVRKIWGKADTVLFIFAGAAAEFAINKAVDWLYFTGRLPADPLGRLFSTITYARQIIFEEEEKALAAIDRITAIHRDVEKNRGANIPDWAYRDVLFLLIDYSIRSYELLEKELTAAEKEDVFRVFYRVGARMKLEGLPRNLNDWNKMREQHLVNDLIRSEFTVDLYQQYKKHLGGVRYTILLQVQYQLAPVRVSRLLLLHNRHWLSPLLKLYKASRLIKADSFLKSCLLPKKYKNQISGIDQQ